MTWVRYKLLGTILLGTACLSVDAAAQGIIPTPNPQVLQARDFVIRGEKWLQRNGLFENYDTIRKEYKAPLWRVYMPAALGNAIAFAQYDAESLIQQLAVQYTAEQVRLLKAQGVDVIDTLLRQHHTSGRLSIPVLISEIIVEGKVVRTTYKERADGNSVIAVFVISQVFKGKVSVGDTIHILGRGGPHSFLKYYGKDNYILEEKHNRMIVGAIQKSYPLMVTEYPQLMAKGPPPQDLRSNEYYQQYEFIVSGGILVGTQGASSGVKFGTRQNLRNVIKRLSGEGGGEVSQEPVDSIPLYFKNRVVDSDAIVVAKVIGWTTPLTSMQRYKPSFSKSPQDIGDQYNTVIHFRVLESLKGSYRVGDTIGYMQLGGNVNNLFKTWSSDDLLDVSSPYKKSSSGEYLLYLYSYPLHQKNSYFKLRNKDGGLNRSRPQEVNFPVFVRAGIPYLLDGDIQKPIGCSYAPDVLFPGKLHITRRLIKKITQ